MATELEPDWWLAQWQGVNRPQQLCVAFSGGRDSSVLLHSLARWVPTQAPDSPSLRAVHVDHGMQAASPLWARQCHAQAAQWSVDCAVLSVQVCNDGRGPEAAARRARYNALAQHLQPGEVLVTAHHQGDQAETVLLQLLRGAGVDGLAAMPNQTERNGFRHWRPALAVSADAIAAYAERHALAWIDDPSNQDRQMRRNWLRHEILPQLRVHHPQLDQQLARTAAQMAEARQQLREQAQQWLQPLLLDGGQGLDLQGLDAHRPADQKLILRRWLRAQGPSAGQLDRVIEELIHAGPDRQPVLALSEVQLRRFRGGLWRMPPLSGVQPGMRQSLVAGHLALPGGAGALTVDGPNSLLQGLEWSFAGGGERIRPAGTEHHRSLKQLHQAAGIPPWIRERTPLIWRGEQLLSVGGYWNSEAFEAMRAAGLALRWQHRLCAEPRTSLRWRETEIA